MKYSLYYVKSTHKEDIAEIHLTPRSAFITKGSESSAQMAVTYPVFRPGPPAQTDTEQPTSRPSGQAGMQQRAVWEKRSLPSPSPKGLTEGREPAWGSGERGSSQLLSPSLCSTSRAKKGSVGASALRRQPRSLSGSVPGASRGPIPGTRGALGSGPAAQRSAAVRRRPRALPPRLPPAGLGAAPCAGSSR